MPPDLWAAFVAATLALMIVPGPTMMLTLSYALNRGRPVALACALGVATGDLIAMSVSLLGLGALLLASATAFGIVKWVGAAYLVWLGIRLIRGTAATGPGKVPPRATPRSVYAHALTVTALNPKSLTFFIAFVPQFLSPGAPLAPQFALLIATFVTIAGLFALSVALTADLLRGQIARPLVLAWLTRAGGGALVAMGALTATLRRPVS